MEMGGVMAHGAIVAREYGIPAVVGVSGATGQIETGDSLTVDGATGVITLLPETGSEELDRSLSGREESITDGTVVEYHDDRIAAGNKEGGYAEQPEG